MDSSEEAPAVAKDDAAIADLDHVDASSDTLETIVLKVGVHGDVALPAEEDGEAMETDTPAKTPNRRQRYRSSWEKIPELKEWLAPVEGNPYTAWCRHCSCGLTCHLKNLMVHAKSTKHMKRKMTRKPAPAPPPSEQRGGGRGHWITAPPRTRARSSQGSPPGRGRVTSPSPPASPLPPYSPPTKTEQVQLDVCYGDTDRVNYSIGLHNQTVGFVGGGCIAQATLKGMMDKGIISPGNVIVGAPSYRNLDAWRRWGCSSTQDNAEVVQEADLIIVAVKPQVAETVFKGLGSVLNDDRERCFVSLVTGWSRQRIIQTMTSSRPEVNEEAKEAKFHVVRCVPNLSVSIGEGSSVYCCGEDLSRRWLLAVETVFSALGTCKKSDEYLMDVYSGAFSSGTAFALGFIDALASGAVNLGVPWHEALQMAAKTTSGAARLVLESGRSPSELRRDASSAGGSTLAGTMALQKAGLEYAVMSAVQASSERCSQLGAAKHPAE